MKNSFLLILFFILIISGCSSAVVLPDGHEATSEHLEGHEQDNFHIHADFKVYINDEPIDFSVLMYQLRDKSVHIESGVGERIHVHKEGITIGDFFKTLGIEFNSICITIPIEGTYCNEDDKKLSFYVNGAENNEFEKYEIKNSDKILVSYG